MADRCSEIETKLAEKVSRKALWIALLAIGIPIFATGAVVWSNVRGMDDRFVTMREMEPNIKCIEANKTALSMLPDMIKKIERSQEECNKGINDILKILIAMEGYRAIDYGKPGKSYRPNDD